MSWRLRFIYFDYDEFILDKAPASEQQIAQE
jgi:hypothetical protein